jgi:hypothetical protein
MEVTAAYSRKINLERGIKWIQLRIVSASWETEVE